MNIFPLTSSQFVAVVAERVRICLCIQTCGEVPAQFASHRDTRIWVHPPRDLHSSQWDLAQNHSGTKVGPGTEPRTKNSNHRHPHKLTGNSSRLNTKQSSSKIWSHIPRNLTQTYTLRKLSLDLISIVKDTVPHSATTKTSQKDLQQLISHRAQGAKIQFLLNHHHTPGLLATHLCWWSSPHIYPSHISHLMHMNAARIKLRTDHPHYRGHHFAIIVINLHITCCICLSGQGCI